MSEHPQYWSSEVTATDRHDVGGGVFATGSAQEIAQAVIDAARDDGAPETIERRAMAKLTFYENRAGHKLSPERRAILEDAKTIVRADAQR
ncbi:MAG TPA: DUF3175 domain-containing protein [Candidatus Acidoferrales bacterium]|nr:DUF3175 domain-containing protein [Candidatus Acidoferrales bacterium]